MFDFLNLTTGSSGKIIEKLQGWLNELLKLKPPLEVTGFFDPKTGAAVRKFQQQNNIPIWPPAGRNHQNVEIDRQELATIFEDLFEASVIN